MTRRSDDDLFYRSTRFTWMTYFKVKTANFAERWQVCTSVGIHCMSRCDVVVTLNCCCIDNIQNSLKKKIYIYIYIYTVLGVAQYMYSYRTVMVRASRFGAWGLTMNTGNSPPIQKGAPAEEQRMPWVAHLKTKPPTQWPCADSECVSHIDWQRSIF